MRKRVRPYLVTGAAISREEEFRFRRRRYLITMIMRLVLLVAAALTVRHSVFLAIVLGILSTVIPAFAVVMANDGPPKNSKYYRRVAPEGQRERALAAGTGDNDKRAITAEPVIIEQDGATSRPEDERGKDEQQ